MPALESAEIVETRNVSARKACLTTGCPCRDARIVSSRRAAFYAAVARASGETADRAIPAEPGWRISAVATASLDLPLALPDGTAWAARLSEELRPAAATLTERNIR